MRIGPDEHGKKKEILTGELISVENVYGNPSIL